MSLVKVDWEALEKLPQEEQEAFWEARRQSELEEDFKKLMNSPFDSLRSEYRYRHYNREDAVKLQKMLEDKLGVSDPEGPMPEEAWRQSNWCSE